jgi:hypothetical protein
MVRASPELPRADKHRFVWSLGKLKTRRHYTPTPLSSFPQILLTITGFFMVAYNVEALAK